MEIAGKRAWGVANRPSRNGYPKREAAREEVVPRSLYVTKADLERFGRTPLCPGCEAALLDLPTRARNTECRQRIQVESDKTPEGKERIKRAKERLEAGKRPRQAETAAGAGPLPPAPPGLGGEAEGEVLVLRPRVPLDVEMAAGEAAGEPLADAEAGSEIRRREVEREDSPKRRKGGSPVPKGEKRTAQVEVEELHAQAQQAGGPASGSTDRPAQDASSGAVVAGSAPAGERQQESNQEMLHLCSLLREVVARGKVAEIFSPPRVAAQAQVVGLAPGFSIDLSTQRGDGLHWDLSKDSRVQDLMQLIEHEQPEFLGGSPPCGPFSKLQNLVDARNNVTKEVRAKRLAAGKRHLRTAVTYRDKWIQEDTSIMNTQTDPCHGRNVPFNLCERAQESLK